MQGEPIARGAKPRRFSNVLQLAGAVANALGRHAHAVEHGEVEIGHRRFSLQLDVATRSQRAATATGQQDGQVVVVVAVAVPDGAVMKVTICVGSLWNASAIMSYISRRCAWYCFGTPVGRTKSGSDAANFSACWMRCSSSRTAVRYSSSLCRSV